MYSHQADEGLQSIFSKSPDCLSGCKGRGEQGAKVRIYCIPVYFLHHRLLPKQRAQLHGVGLDSEPYRIEVSVPRILPRFHPLLYKRGLVPADRRPHSPSPRGRSQRTPGCSARAAAPEYFLTCSTLPAELFRLFVGTGAFHQPCLLFPDRAHLGRTTSIELQTC